MNRPVSVRLPNTHREQPIEERVLRRGGFEAGQRTEIVVRVVAHASECHVDQCAVVGLERQPEIELERSIGGHRVLLNGKDVSARIRERDVTEAASRASVHPKVREWMVARQREMGIGGGVVMEGRDIGTKVFPDADLKIFLDADPVIREQRRLDQQKVKGAPAQTMAAELRERDRRDRTRVASPLVAAEDAVVLDSTNMSEDEVLNRIEELVKQRQAARS